MISARTVSVRCQRPEGMTRPGADGSRVELKAPAASERASSSDGARTKVTFIPAHLIMSAAPWRGREKV
jgi:hypothetical protein